MDGGDSGPAPQNPDHPKRLPAGITFLGQFIDHDITFDPTSSLERQADPEAVENFRTPVLELDNVYGAGPGANPHLYRRTDKAMMLLGPIAEHPAATDLPRNDEGTALLGDPRNDENLIVSQLHVAFLRFHNAVAEHVRQNKSPRETLFEATQRLVRWHYQWIVLHEYLPAIVGQEMVNAVLARRRFYNWRNEPFIPVEFSVAAFRFGHTQVRPGYRISEQFARPLFAQGPPAAAGELPSDLSGGRRIRKEQVIEWQRFFKLTSDDPQPGKAFDPRLSSPLHHLPFAAGTPDDPASLAQRNLIRGLTFSLPSGQSVATAMRDQHNEDVKAFKVDKIEVLGADTLTELKAIGLEDDTPLWYYILRESELRANGERLGPVGGRIVAEVLIGLLQGDRFSYLRVNPSWKPLFGGADFRLKQLLLRAGVATEAAPPGPPPGAIWSQA